MARAVGILVILASAAAGHAGADASLEPAAQQDPGLLPYRQAQLTIRQTEKGSAPVIRAVALRQTLGGPTLLFGVTVPPGTSHSALVPLPAVFVQETYAVRLLTEPRVDAPVVAEQELSISWPPELLATDFWIDPAAYEPWQFDLPRWPRQTLWGVFVAALLSCLAMASALFIRPPTIRLVALLILVAASCVAVMIPLRAMPTLVARRVNLPRVAGIPLPGALWVLTCRRTGNWTHEAATMQPVYQDRRQMLADQSVIVDGSVLRVPIRPDEVRLFRQWDQRPAGK